MRILIGIPTYDRRVDCELLKTLIHVERRGDHKLDYMFPISSHLSRNRNMCVHEAMKNNHDALLFLDSDIGIQDESFIEKLIETSYKFDAGIVGGAYRMKKSELIYVAAKKVEKLENIKKIPIYPQLVDAVGTGIMLILKEVFQKIDDPWFTIVDKPNLEVNPEDFYFCEKAREKGIQIALDPRFSTNHWGMNSWTH